MKIVLIGVLGFVGCWIVCVVVEVGYDIDFLFGWCLGDLLELVGCDVLIYCVFQYIFGKYCGGEGDDFMVFICVNLIGLLVLFDVVKVQGVGWVIFLFLCVVYDGYVLGIDLMDDLLFVFISFYGKVKVDVEVVLYGMVGFGFCIVSLCFIGVFGFG